MIDEALKIIADRFGCICDYSPSDEEMGDEWCWEHCGTVEDWVCWKRWVEMMMEKQNESHISD